MSLEQELIVYKQQSETEESWLQQSGTGNEQDTAEDRQKQDAQRVQQQSEEVRRQIETSGEKCVQSSAEKSTRKRRTQQEEQQLLQQSVEEVIRKRQRNTPKWMRDYVC